MTEQTASSESAVVAKLRAANKKVTGEASYTLPGSGVRVTYPKFRAFAGWELAQRQAEGSPTSVNLYYIIQVCRFDGERIRLEDYRELISDTDHMAISARIFGSQTGEPAEGNA